MPKNETSSTPPHPLRKTESPKPAGFLEVLDARKAIQAQGAELAARKLATIVQAFHEALYYEETHAAPGSDMRAQVAKARGYLNGTVAPRAATPPPAAPEPRSDGRLLSALLERTGELAAGLEALLIVANGKGGLSAKLEAIERIEQETLARLEELEAKIAPVEDVDLDLFTWDKVRGLLKLRDAQLLALVRNGVLERDEETGLFHQGLVTLAQKRWAPIAKALASDTAVDWAGARAALLDQKLIDDAADLERARLEEVLVDEAAHLTPPIPPPEAERPDDAPPLPYSHEEEDPDGYRKGDIARDEAPVVDRRTLSTGGDS